MNRREIDRRLWALTLPTFATLISEPLMVLADTAFVGHLGTPALAGLGIGGSALGLLLGLSVFLAYGTTSRVGRLLGAGDRPGALAAGVDGIVLGAGLGLVLAVALSLASPFVPGWYGATGPVADAASAYLRIVAFSLPGALGVLAATGVLRGLQDTRTPLVVAVSANVLNVALNATLIFVAGLGIAGAALGTTLAQTAAGVVLAATVVRTARAAGAPRRVRPAAVLAAAASGGWLVIRSAALQVTMLLSTAVATRLGAAQLAAHQVTNALWSFLCYVLDAIAIACQALIGNRLGAGEVEETRAITRRSLGWGVAFGLGVAALLALARPLLIGVFTPDPDVRGPLLGSVLVLAAMVPLGAIVFVLDGVLIGAGDARYLAFANSLATACFVPLALLVRPGPDGLTWLWVAYSGYLLARMLTLVVRARGDAWLRTGA
ncbi:MATE family efflux transporter [Nigerium massiliense]|uniref:MATE family efflux transporter n=1 Tax=Nigerium massiliense TaxID=1522317 RepID=UPI00058E929B|nr:MATE family efflux transporter [Nigerium massiliense]